MAAPHIVSDICINVASSSSARELLTRLETGHCCNRQRLGGARLANLINEALK